jgi:hypothetical protein
VALKRATLHVLAAFIGRPQAVQIGALRIKDYTQLMEHGYVHSHRRAFRQGTFGNEPNLAGIYHSRGNLDFCDDPINNAAVLCSPVAT